MLRGPQSTLYGSGSLAGNVRYIMTKPELRKFSGKVSMGYGLTEGSDGDNLNPDLVVNVPLGDTFAIRANIGQIKNAGVVDYPNVYVLDAKGDPVVTNGDIVNAKPVYHYVKDADTVDIRVGDRPLVDDLPDVVLVEERDQPVDRCVDTFDRTRERTVVDAREDRAEIPTRDRLCRCHPGDATAVVRG